MDIEYDPEQKKFKVFLKVDLEKKKEELKEKAKAVFKEKAANFQIEFQKLNESFKQTKFYHDWVGDIEDARGRIKNYRDEVKTNLSESISGSLEKSEPLQTVQQKFGTVSSVVKEKY